jgi:hypothetical protein
MFAQIGLGVDIGAAILVLAVLGLGFLAVVVSLVFGALGVRALLRKAPATRLFRIAAIFLVLGIALVGFTFWLRTALRGH